MKKLPVIFTIILLVAMTIPAMAASAINQDGYYKGIKLVLCQDLKQIKMRIFQRKTNICSLDSFYTVV